MIQVERHSILRHSIPRRPIPRRRGARVGYSMIEILLAVSIVSLLLSAVAVSMQAMYRVDRQLRDNAGYANVVSRLSLQLRTDAHGADEVALLAVPNPPAANPATNPPAAKDANGVVLTRHATGETIEYQWAAGRVARIRRSDQRELGREYYALGQAVALQWRINASLSPSVELQITRTVGKVDAPDARQVDQIIAVVGLREPQETKGAASATEE